MTTSLEPNGQVRAVIETERGVWVAWAASVEDAREMARWVEREVKR